MTRSVRLQQQKLGPLRRDVHFLGELLGEVLIHQEGYAFFRTEERIRRLAIAVRRQGGAHRSRGAPRAPRASSPTAR